MAARPSLASPQIHSGGETLYAVSLEVRHDCPVGNLSRKLADLRIVHWCVNNRDMFLASGPDDDVRTFRGWVEQDFGTRHVSSNGDGVLLITETCRCGPGSTRSVGEAIRSAGAWDIPPIVYRAGWESWRALAWNGQILRAMFSELRKRGDLRILSLRPIENVAIEKMMLVPASDIFAGLTERQSSALLVSLRHGYYATPSGTNLERLAEGVGLAPSTFGEHLRKAEGRILENLRPYLEVYASRGAGEVAVEEVRTPSPERRRPNEPVHAIG